ncbi:nuclear transport factor 2 family protein [Ekhidna sp.]
MKKILATFILIFTSIYSMAQSPEEIVQQQLDLYNNKDLQGFMSLFSEDATLINQSDGKVLATGKSEVEKLYSNLFQKSPNLYSELKNRMVLGNTIIDHENITGRLGKPEAIELIVMYEVRSQQIFRCTVIRGELK